MLEFAEEATNSLDQDLLLLAKGLHNKEVKQRMRQYEKFLDGPMAELTDFATKYGERIREALSNFTTGPATYIPGAQIAGDKLRTFSDKPTISGPLVCQLCEANFTTEKDFARHKIADHAGEVEYRKRVLYLMAEAGPRPITAQEKRIIVQNFARFQQYCRLGSPHRLKRCCSAC